MLTLFKKIFGKGGTKSVTADPVPPTAAAQMQFESAIQMAKVEVAKLSLAAVVQKFPQDLRDLVTKLPDDTMTVALPIQTIVKQLPSGVVRMSLASLHRQAPSGIFKPLPAGDKRMVEVPLAEVFKHVKPTVLKRRTDQRPTELPEEDLAVFNNRHKAAPAPPAPQPTAIAPQAPDTASIAPPAALTALPAAMRVVAPPTDLQGAAPKAARTAKSAADSPSGHALVLPLQSISAAWPEALRQELAALDPATTVSLPEGDVKVGLARGKIASTWGKLRASLTPPASADTAFDPATPLVLPLKVIAPAFLAQSKRPAAGRKAAVVDDSIPALFNSKQPPAAAAEPAAPPAEDSSQKSEPALPAIEAVAAEPPTKEDPAPEASAAEIPAEEKVSEETPTASAPAEAPAEPTPAPPASAVGAAFGEPDKTTWTPAELVSRVAKLPNVAGAVVALQEGFPVAQALPPDVNAETVAAFLPQIFGRLNQYAGEMKLGEVDDLLFTTRGAHCLIYRLGTVYFAVLGKPGASLPWNELRLVAAELSRQVQK